MDACYAGDMIYMEAGDHDETWPGQDEVLYIFCSGRFNGGYLFPPRRYSCNPLRFASVVSIRAGCRFLR